MTKNLAKSINANSTIDFLAYFDYRFLQQKGFELCMGKIQCNNNSLITSSDAKTNCCG